MTNQQGAPEALTDPSPDQLRAIARTARNSSGSASDDCGPLAYVLHGWRAAVIAFRAQQAAMVEAQQPAPSAADECGRCVGTGRIDTGVGALGHEVYVDCPDCQTAPTPQADPLQPVVSLQEQAGMYADDFAPQADRQPAAGAVAGPVDDLAELALLNRLIELGSKAACAHAMSNSDDGHKGTAAYVEWQELRAEMGELVRTVYAAAPQPSPTPQADSAPLAAPADIVVLEAALRAIHQAIDLIGEPDTERLRTVRRVLRGAVVVAEDSTAPQADSQPARNYPPLPTRRRAFRCRKCGGRECEPGTLNETHPTCKCGYLGFAEDLDFTADEMRAYADDTHALRTSHGQASDGWTDADADAARLALELECLLMDTKDAAVVSKWWASANDALEMHRTRLKDMPPPATQSDRLLKLADELDEQLTSGAKWSPAQHACCNVSTALRDIAQSPSPKAPTPQADSVPSRFGSPELQAMILARCVEKDQADSVLEDAARYRWIRESERADSLIKSDCRGVFLPQRQALDAAIDTALFTTPAQRGEVAGDGNPCNNDHDPDCRWPDCICRHREVRFDAARKQGGAT